MTNKELCLAWLEWFKKWVETHDLLHSNNVLATTTKTFNYTFSELETSSDEYNKNYHVQFNGEFLFKFKFVDKEVIYPLLLIRNEYTNKEEFLKKEDNFYNYILGYITRIIVYGRDFMNVATIFAGKANLNWRNNEEKNNSKTLRDIINEVHPKTFRDESSTNNN